MRKIILLLFSWMLFSNIHAQTYRIATYNIRLQTDGDVGNLWEQRAPAVSNLIAFHEFDIFGTQEGFENQLHDIQNLLPQYERYGVGRDDGKNAGEHSAIFFLKNKFKKLKSGDFWLSETPEKPSKGWDATYCNRLVSWVLLKDVKFGSQFFVFNTHYDHEGVRARKESSLLILQKIKQIAGKQACIFMGDMNGSEQTDCYQIIRSSGWLIDTRTLSKKTYLPNGSFNGFKNPPIGNDIIDHIFVNKNFKVYKWGVLTDTYNGKFPSDHFPISTIIKLQKNK